MFFNNSSKRNSNNNLQNLSSGGYGREIDRNQLSVEIMNITPIMEEKGEFQQIDPIVKNFQITSKEENIIEQQDEQFSFDQDFNFNAVKNEQEEKDMIKEFKDIEERFSINYNKDSNQAAFGNLFTQNAQTTQYRQSLAALKQYFPIYDVSI